MKFFLCLIINFVRRARASTYVLYKVKMIIIITSKVAGICNHYEIFLECYLLSVITSSFFDIKIMTSERYSFRNQFCLFFVGSGQQILGPPRKKQTSDDVTQSIFDDAKR